MKLHEKLENKDTIVPSFLENRISYSSIVKDPKTFSVILEPSSNEAKDHKKERT